MSLHLRLRPHLGLLLLLASFVAAAGAAPAGEPRQADAAGLRYLVLETEGAGPGAVLPMVIGLHYSGAAPEAMLDYLGALGVPARIVLPRGPVPRRDGWTWFSDDAASGQAGGDAAVDAMVERLAGFAAAVRKAHPTHGKPVVMGVSYGGDLSLLLALRHPGSFVAAFPVAARLLPAWMPSANTCAGACPPIRALHGAADAVVPMAPTAAAVRRLEAMGFDARLTQYPGVAHDFDATMQRDFIRQVEFLLGK